MARRRFNKNQKRDKNGRWTSGGGSSSKAKVSKAKTATKTKAAAKPPSKTAAAAARRKTIQRRRNVAVTSIAAVSLAANGRMAVKHGAMAGVMMSRGRYIMASAHGVSSAASAYRGVSFAAELGVKNSKRFTAKQKETFSRRKANVDKQVRRVEKVSNAVLAGGYFLGVAGPVAASYARSRREGRVPAANALMAGLKVNKPGRGGVYNLSSFKGKRV